MAGFGDKLKKMAKAVNEAQHTIATTQAILQGRPPPAGAPAPPAQAPPQPPPDVRCAYCGGLVKRGTPKCPNCNAPL